MPKENIWIMVLAVVFGHVDPKIIAALIICRFSSCLYTYRECANLRSRCSSAILAHWRDDDSVLKRGAADAQWLEKSRHRLRFRRSSSARNRHTWRDSMLRCEVRQPWDSDVVVIGGHIGGFEA
jgi:hypothetical protein